MNKNISSVTRIFRVLRKIDRDIEKWVHHLINQIEDENRNQSNQTE